MQWEVKIEQIYSSDYDFICFDNKYFIGSYEMNSIDIILDGEGKEVNIVVAAEDYMLKRIDYYYDGYCYQNKGMCYISGKELEGRDS